MREDPLMLVLPTGHPLASKKAVAIKDLEALPFVMCPPGAGTGIDPQIYRLCQAAGFVPRVAQTAGEASTIIGLAAAGSGITLLPASFDHIRMDGVVYRPLLNRAATTMLLLAQRGGEHAPLVDAFVALVTDAANPISRK